MKADISIIAPADDAAWKALGAQLNMGTSNLLLENLIARFRGMGSVSIVRESSYIDRDFSAAYTAFYAKLFKPIAKHCVRLHFFAVDLTAALANSDPGALLNEMSDARDLYLGDVVLRPLMHAPVSSARVAAAKLSDPKTQEIAVRSPFTSHVLGTEFVVEAMPLTQQDTRTGACAQAAMWMTGRHFYNRHSARWFSMPAITEAALKPTDSGITRSLPAGSEYLTQDNMVRALRAMGRHPVTYVPDAIVNNVPTWQNVRPKDVISRYVDSGIPVILGLQQAGTSIGHGVVAVGVERTDVRDLTTMPLMPTQAEFVTHFLVNDDQRGAYCRLPVSAADKTAEYPFCLDTDIKFLLVPLPEKVFMTAETAELIARDIVTRVSVQRQILVEAALGAGSGWDEDPDFYKILESNTAFARTYLTYGWKHKARMVRNAVSDQHRSELLRTQLPKYVWVTEFSAGNEVSDLDPCKRKIRAHAVVDASGSRFWDSTLAVNVPGLAVFWHFDPKSSGTAPLLVLMAEKKSGPYWPKIRGSENYDMCAVA